MQVTWEPQRNNFRVCSRPVLTCHMTAKSRTRQERKLSFYEPFVSLRLCVRINVYIQKESALSWLAQVPIYRAGSQGESRHDHQHHSRTHQQDAFQSIVIGITLGGE